MEALGRPDYLEGVKYTAPPVHSLGNSEQIPLAISYFPFAIAKRVRVLYREPRRAEK